MKEIKLENGFLIYVEEVDEKALDFTMINTRSKDNEFGFQTIITKKDAREIIRTLDYWLSNIDIE